MAGRQAAALLRVGRLRSGTIAAVKETFPLQFAEAEGRLGRRMSQVDDEHLLAYLSGFLNMPQANTAARAGRELPDGMDKLRAALTAIGMDLPYANDPEEWARAAEAWSQGRATSASRTVAGTPIVEMSAARVSQEVLTSPDAEVAEDWEAMFSESELELPVEHPASVTAGKRDMSGTPAPAKKGRRSTRRRNERDAKVSATPSTPSAPPTGKASTNKATPFEDDINEIDEELLDFNFPDFDEFEEADFATPADGEQEEPLPEPVAAAEPPAVIIKPKRPDPDPAAVEAFENALRPDPNAPVTTHTALLPIRPTPIAPAPSKAPARRQRQGRKEPRVTAAAPAGFGKKTTSAADVALAATGGELTDELRDKLMAVVCTPRPVFTSDLVAMVDSVDLISQWEKEQFTQGGTSKLRFVQPKSRHKARGSLLIPADQSLRDEAPGFRGSEWDQALDAPNLTGAKIYELGILLHTMLDKIVTFDIGTSTVELRVNQPQGVVGIIQMLEPDVREGTEARAELETRLKVLAKSRLSLLAVCTQAAGPKPRMDLATAVEAIFKDHKISPPFHVVAETSSVFAENGGATALAIK